MIDEELRLREFVREVADTAPPAPTALDIARRMAEPERSYNQPPRHVSQVQILRRTMCDPLVAAGRCTTP